MKTIAISQSNYLPWAGYFKLIDSVDEFIFFDEVQYTRRDWRNRNKILLDKKIKWLSLSVENKGNFREKINKIKVSDKNWKEKHVQILTFAYRKYPYFDKVIKFLDEILDKEEIFLSKINQKTIIDIARFLGIKTKFYNSIDLTLFNQTKSDASSRLVEICKIRKANNYISGPAAKNYLNLSKFELEDIKINWFDYNIKKEMIDENLSIIHMLMKHGKNKKEILGT
jgi:hypothetical protein